MSSSAISGRLDKWLWAARFFKTRQLANKAVRTGRIAINGQTTRKPAAAIKPADQLHIKRGAQLVEIVVDNLSEQRGSATVAQSLYHETENSIAQRQRLKMQLATQPRIDREPNKPGKQAVRQLRAFKRGQQ